MPLIKTIFTQQGATVHVWRITETFDELFSIHLKEESLERVLKMKSELHQKGFLSVRHLLKHAGYSDTDLYYTSNGKPHLKDNKHISITHSFHYAAIIIGGCDVGIDIEKNREKIVKIAHKFIGSEKSFLTDHQLVEQLMVIWGAKESLYKIYPHEGLTFKNHIFVDPFKLTTGGTTAAINIESWNKKYDISFEQFDGFTLVYALPNHDLK